MHSLLHCVDKSKVLKRIEKTVLAVKLYFRTITITVNFGKSRTIAEVSPLTSFLCWAHNFHLETCDFTHFLYISGVQEQSTFKSWSNYLCNWWNRTPIMPKYHWALNKNVELHKKCFKSKQIICFIKKNH